MNQVDTVNEIGKDLFFFVRVPTKKRPFAEGIPLGLLVRFLWANKENEHDRRVKRRIAK